MNSLNTCAECGSEVTTSNFCTNCQKNVKLVRKNLFCTECGGKIPQDSNTCADCGSDISVEEPKSSDKRGCITVLVSGTLTIIVTLGLIGIGIGIGIIFPFLWFIDGEVVNTTCHICKFLLSN